MRLLFIISLAAILFVSEAQANAYAPWEDCEGLQEGDECGERGGYYHGHCVLHEVEDCGYADTASPENECLWCDSDSIWDEGGCSSIGRADAAVFGMQGLALMLALLTVRRRR